MIIKKGGPRFEHKSVKIVADKHDFTKLEDCETWICDNPDQAIAITKAFNTYNKRKTVNGKWRHVVGVDDSGKVAIQFQDNEAYLKKIEDDFQTHVKNGLFSE